MNRRAPETKTRTREDKAMALSTRLILATPQRVAELIAGHTVESFAKAHGVTPAMIRGPFEQAVARHG